MGSDLELDQVLCIPLGIIPRTLDNGIRKCSRVFYKYCQDPEIYKIMEQNLLKHWKEITETNIVRVVDLLSIIGNVSNHYKTDFKENG